MGSRSVPLAFSVALSAISLLPMALLAAGVSSLVEYELLTDPSRDGGRPLAKPRATLENPPDAAAILHRNPFDSTTGPLDRARETAPAVVPLAVDPLAAPSCESVSVYSTIESTDPYWSSAVIQGERELHGQVRRPGDRVDGLQVVFIGFNPLIRSPAVWFQSQGQLCQGVLFDGKPRRGAATAAPRAPKEKATPKASGGPLPKVIADKIARRSATEFDVDKSAVDAIFGDYAKLMRGTKVRPVTANGKVVGLRLTGIRPDSLLGKLGWNDGDQIQSINGFVLTSPDKALEAYARLRTANRLTVRLLRGGKSLSLDYHVK